MLSRTRISGKRLLETGYDNTKHFSFRGAVPKTFAYCVYAAVVIIVIITRVDGLDVGDDAGPSSFYNTDEKSENGNDDRAFESFG